MSNDIMVRFGRSTEMSNITHYNGCWHDQKHHACAVREIEQHQIWLSEMVEDFRLDADAYDLSRRRAIAEALRNARVEIERLREELLTRHAEARKQAEKIERLRKEVEKYARRTQILWEWMHGGDGLEHRYFLSEHPEAAEWFNEDGVPR